MAADCDFTVRNDAPIITFLPDPCLLRPARALTVSYTEMNTK
jgi:hypothetical protein